MKIDIFYTARSLRPFEREWIDHYLERTGAYAALRLHRLREIGRGSPAETAVATWREVERRLPGNAWRILLDGGGAPLTTDGLAGLFGRIRRERKGRAAFVVGGSHGLPRSALQRADTVLSLSPLTLPHRVALLVLAEQIYRVLSREAGSPYHHG